MAQYANAVITNNGLALISKAQAGQRKIKFTRLASGNGTYTAEMKADEALKGMTALKSEKQTFLFDAITANGTNSVKLAASITNHDDSQTLDEGYYVTEIGLYAEEEGVPDSEILYGVAVADIADFLPPYNGTSAAVIIQEYYIAVDNSANVTIQDSPYNKIIEEIKGDVEDLKKSVSDGKSLVASAITRKNVPTEATDSFQTMANNIDRIVLGSGNAQPQHVLEPYTFTNDSGIELTGTLPDDTPEVMAQTNLLPQAFEALTGKLSGANATAETIMKGYSAYVNGKLIHGTLVVPTGLMVVSPPTKIAYKVGETLNLAGIRVDMKTADGKSVDVTNQCIYSPANGSVLNYGVNSISINFSGVFVSSQAITVQRELASIAITKAPTKTSYLKGEALNLTGMVVTATYKDGSTQDVTSKCVMSPASGFVLSTVGNVSVTVSYTENTVMKTTSTNVTVNVKIVTWAGGTDQEIVDMVAAHDAGIINLRNYWSVGQERNVSLTAIPVTFSMESQVAQEITLILTHPGGKTLVNGKECAFQVDQKNCLEKLGGIVSSYVYENSWRDCQRRQWCNEAYRNAFPEKLKSIFKQFKNKTYTRPENALVETVDYFALRAECEIFENLFYGYANEGIRVEYYKLDWNNSKKRLGNNGDPKPWFQRSLSSEVIPKNNCCANNSGGPSQAAATDWYGIAPFGCI